MRLGTFSAVVAIAVVGVVAACDDTADSLLGRQNAQNGEGTPAPPSDTVSPIPAEAESSQIPQAPEIKP